MELNPWYQADVLFTPVPFPPEKHLKLALCKGEESERRDAFVRISIFFLF